MSTLRRVVDFLLQRSAPARVVPENPEQARILARADATLEDPRIRRILSRRDRELRASFARAEQRLSGR